MDPNYEILSSLVHNSAFLCLCGVFETKIKELEARMDTAETAPDILRLVRVWQVSRSFLEVLKTEPARMLSQIESETGRPTLETFFPAEQ